MNCSMTPLHSGSPTYDGVILIPSHFTSLIHASAMYWGPQSHRIRDQRAASRAEVPPRELMDAATDGAGEPAPAILFGVEARRVRAPHFIRRVMVVVPA